MAGLTATLKVRVESKQRRELERLAAAEGIPLGTYLRLVLRDHLTAAAAAKAS